MQVQNFIKSLCILYLLCRWSLSNQTRCAVLLLLITKPSTTKWTLTDRNTFTCSIIRHSTGGYFAAQGNKSCLIYGNTNVFNWMYLYLVMMIDVSLCAALNLLMKQAVRPDSPLKGHERTVQYLQHLGQLTMCPWLSIFFYDYCIQCTVAWDDCNTASVSVSSLRVLDWSLSPMMRCMAVSALEDCAIPPAFRSAYHVSFAVYGSVCIRVS